jgi:hypothetical protein
VCGRPECQRQRRTDYHRKKLATDPEYHQVALESQKQWRDEHPDYQKQRRRQWRTTVNVSGSVTRSVAWSVLSRTT